MPTPSLTSLLQKHFSLPNFREHQEPVCQDLMKGLDVLLVMPTGAGKSLCYQLPAIALQKTAIVISPLIALMEDQVKSLQANQLIAKTLHSGIPRIEQKSIIQDYLNNKLDFLIIAPERFSVPGFSEILQKQKISLIAIDEAHCISQWGHDFRPDYRTFLSQLDQLRPAPIIALTASATPLVQQDIISQLNRPNLKTHIHGFWRHNIAISIHYLEEEQRIDYLIDFFSNPKNLPAICYTNTRKQAMELAQALKKDIPSTRSYHAGLDSQIRKQIQTDFIENKISIICATVAFGMGIDKANIRSIIHMGIPASLESYYQEIGRAGRDQEHSQAILLFNEDDTRLRQYLHDKRFPNVQHLKMVMKHLTNFTHSTELNEWIHTQEDPRLIQTCIHHLNTHGIITIQGDQFTVHDKPFLENYTHLQEENLKKHDNVEKFLYSSTCRMQYLTQYFGENEQNTSQKQCYICDVCCAEPNKENIQPTSEFTELEIKIINECEAAIKKLGSKTLNQIHALLKNKVERKALPTILFKAKDRFAFQRQKFKRDDGRFIYFVRVSLK